MLLSQSRKFLFIHIYKNAGTSITEALEPIALSTRELWVNRICYRLGRRSRYVASPFKRHLRGHELRGLIPAKQWDALFKFAVVRNAWDWQTSLYEYMLASPSHRQHALAVSLGSFDNYIRWRCTQEVRLQKEFVCDASGSLILDFVARYECLADDWEQICNRIGVSRPLGFANPTKPRDYRAYYSDETAALVAEAFREDIELFGFSFDSGMPQVMTQELR